MSRLFVASFLAFMGSSQALTMPMSKTMVAEKDAQTLTALKSKSSIGSHGRSLEPLTRDVGGFQDGLNLTKTRIIESRARVREEAPVTVSFSASSPSYGSSWNLESAVLDYTGSCSWSGGSEQVALQGRSYGNARTGPSHKYYEIELSSTTKVTQVLTKAVSNLGFPYLGYSTGDHVGKTSIYVCSSSVGSGTASTPACKKCDGTLSVKSSNLEFIQECNLVGSFVRFEWPDKGANVHLCRIQVKGTAATSSTSQTPTLQLCARFTNHRGTSVDSTNGVDGNTYLSRSWGSKTLKPGTGGFGNFCSEIASPSALKVVVRDGNENILLETTEFLLTSNVFTAGPGKQRLDQDGHCFAFDEQGADGRSGALLYGNTCHAGYNGRPQRTTLGVSNGQTYQSVLGGINGDNLPTGNGPCMCNLGGMCGACDSKNRIEIYLKYAALEGDTAADEAATSTLDTCKYQAGWDYVFEMRAGAGIDSIPDSYTEIAAGFERDNGHYIGNEALKELPELEEAEICIGRKDECDPYCHALTLDQLGDVFTCPLADQVSRTKGFKRTLALLTGQCLNYHTTILICPSPDPTGEKCFNGQSYKGTSVVDAGYTDGFKNGWRPRKGAIYTHDNRHWHTEGYGLSMSPWGDIQSGRNGEIGGYGHYQPDIDLIQLRVKYPGSGGSALATPCPEHSSGENVDSGCTCDAGYDGAIGVSDSLPFYTGSCSAVVCPAGSTGNSVSSGCTCDAGHVGSITASSSAPFYTGACSPVECPANSYGTDVVSGCTCAEGYRGTIVASANVPGYTGSCVGVTCPAGSTGTHVASGCHCDAGYVGEIFASNSEPFYTGSCSSVTCPANSRGANVASGCTCDAGFVGTITATKTAPYYTGICSADCEGAWNDWTMCSQTCGSGVQSRTYSVTRDLVGNGEECAHAHGANEGPHECNPKACPGEGFCESVGEWSEFGPCSHTCGESGVQSRSRMVFPDDCEVDIEERACERHPCPVDCRLGEWSSWSVCSNECFAEGQQSRARRIEQQPAHGGLQCLPCNPLEETRRCGEQPSDCELTEWAEWTTCSETCSTGTQSRDRAVERYEKCGGHQCVCNMLESKNCFQQECQIDCEVDTWTDWSACPVDCGGGTQSRTRAITQSNSGGGQECPTTLEYQNCGMNSCLKHCTPSQWSEWSACSATCYGTAQRTRHIVEHAASGGNPCDNLEEMKFCNHQCPVDCQVGAWSEWDTCSRSCGFGTMTRTRPITQRVENGGAVCPDLTEAKTCSCAKCPSEL